MFIAVKIGEVIVTFCCRVLVLNCRHSFTTALRSSGKQKLLNIQKLFVHI